MRTSRGTTKGHFRGHQTEGRPMKATEEDEHPIRRALRKDVQNPFATNVQVQALVLKYGRPLYAATTPERLQTTRRAAVFLEQLLPRGCGAYCLRRRLCDVQ